MPETAVAGICHARGSNADLPPQWLLYFVVEDLDAAVAACTERGGEVVVAPRGLAGGRFGVIRDPAGAELNPDGCGTEIAFNPDGCGTGPALGRVGCRGGVGARVASPEAGGSRPYRSSRDISSRIDSELCIT